MKRYRPSTGLDQLSPPGPTFEQQQLLSLMGRNKGRRQTVRDRQRKSMALRKVKITLATKADL